MSADDLLNFPKVKRGPDKAGNFMLENWWCMRDQTPEDLLLFLQYDSEGAHFRCQRLQLRSGPGSVEFRMVVVL